MLGLLIFAAIALSAMCLKFAPMPFAWLEMLWALVFLVGTGKLTSNWARIVLFNAALIAVLLAPTEIYMTSHEREHPVFSFPYYTADDVLGVVPVKNVHAHSTEFRHGKLVYDVTYTTDANGLRVAPPVKTGKAENSVLFFGCSFTYGEGVQDDQTMPYQVGIQSGGQYQIYNFGFHGYAPNQMLAEIESGRVRQVVAASPRFAIYQALPDHVARVAGKIPYGKHGPRYQLDADGTVRLRGHFDDGQKPLTSLAARLDGQLSKSAIYRTLKNHEPPPDENDVRLLLALVRRSRDLLVAQYPGIEFHVILWRNLEYEEKTYEELQRGFAEMKIPVHLIPDILPDYKVNPGRYWLHPEDKHPNALADRLIADYVVTGIVSPNREVQPLQ
jgi:hypothetical protein